MLQYTPLMSNYTLGKELNYLHLNQIYQSHFFGVFRTTIYIYIYIYFAHIMYVPF